MSGERSPELKALERKYRRLERQKQRERRRGRFPLLLILLILACFFAVTSLLLRLRGQDAKPAPLLTVTVLDIGQGDAILIQSDGHAALIDTGDPDQAGTLMKKLRDAGVDRLDAVINSHPHADHMGGIEAVMQKFSVGVLMLPEIPEALVPTTAGFSSMLETAKARGIPVQTPACGQTVQLGAASLTFLSTDNSARTDLNNCSLGVRLTCGVQSMLFLGDLEAEGEQAMLSAGLLQHTSVLKVSHHGSSGATTAEFLAAVSPQAAVISCGAQNDYGHPHAQTLRRLADAGCTVFRTDLSGDITMTCDGSKIRIETGSR